MSVVGTKTTTTYLLIVTGLFFLMAQLGCKNQPTLTDVYDTNIKKLHICYVTVMQNNGYKGPKDEAEFKDIMKNNATVKFLLERVGVTQENMDSFFVSERDGKPFVVRYGVSGIADHAVVFEAEGVDGKRLVALSNPVEMGAAEYDRHLEGKVKAKESSGYGDG